MNIKQLNERLDKILNEDTKATNVISTLTEGDRLQDLEILHKIQHFIKNNMALKSTEIGDEFLSLQDASDEFYLCAEAIDEIYREDLTHFCKTLILDALKEFKADAFAILPCIEEALKDVFSKEYVKNKQFSDDSLQYTICSLDMPNKIIEFCKALNTTCAKKVISLINKSTICKQANNLLDEITE